MAIHAYIGQAQALNGDQAAVSATQQAVTKSGREKIVAGLVIASHHYSLQQIVDGITSVVGDLPLFGFSTIGEISPLGSNQRTVVVALLCGDLQLQADWWPGYAEDSQAVVWKMVNSMPLDQNSLLLLAADGLNGDARQLCESLPSGEYPLLGCLSGGDVSLRNSYQLGGSKSGVNGLSAALLTSDDLKIGIGWGHGWLSMGYELPVTHSDGLWLRGIGKRTPAEAYARWLGYSADEWMAAPLNRLVRLYPLGLRDMSGDEIALHSPLYIDSDGSLQLHSAIADQSRVSLMVGSSQTCLTAAQDAAQQALSQIEEAQPVLAVVIVDVAWKMLMEAEPGAEIAAVQQILGEDVPLIGGYTFGPIVCNGRPQALNQHLAVFVLADDS